MAAYRLMKVNGLACQVNLPDAPKGDGVHQLPPYHKIDVYNVDDYPACPSNWMRGSDKAASFFFPVDTGKHLWLDFNMNWGNLHEVAAVMSIQGINPITGQRTKTMKMEQYKDGDPCPTHSYDEDGELLEDGEKFKSGRFCEKCGFKWPAQNYLATTTCGRRTFWRDGWRADDDTIRGFLITAETMKGIAAQIIGDDRVWAIGISFFLSKESKPPRQGNVLRSVGFEDASAGGVENYTQTSFKFSSPASSEVSLGGQHTNSSGHKWVRSRGGISGQSVSRDVREVETEKLEIAAGAKISQGLGGTDTNPLNYYQESPAGVIYGNYCTTDDFNTIIETGVVDRTAGGEGFMAGLETGNHD